MAARGLPQNQKKKEATKKDQKTKDWFTAVGESVVDCLHFPF